MDRSTNYNFYLPGNGDYRDVSQFNYNFETIDTQLAEAVTKLNGIVQNTSTINETNLANFEAALLTVFTNMADNEIRFAKVLSNWSASGTAGSPTAGAFCAAILFRRSSGIYKISIPDTCTSGYYYSNAWHWTKATMASVTF